MKAGNEINCRIVKADGRDKYAGTGENSWFTVEKARELVDRSNGEKIEQYDLSYSTTRALWEVM